MPLALKDSYGVITCTLAMLMPMAAVAQSADSSLQLEEIVVTAQKREQSSQDVPFSVSVVRGETLDSQSITDFGGLFERLPNVTLSTSPFGDAVSIRGIGSGQANPATEQAVAMFVDGVYVSRPNQFNAPFLDVASVEVLKGPQGVLQGKNAVAGAIVINSRRPTEETEGFIRTSYEFENGGYLLEGGASGKVADNLYMRLVAGHELVGGWIDRNDRLDPATGDILLNGNKDINEGEQTNIALSAVWDASDTFSLFTKLTFGKKELLGQGIGVTSVQPGSGDETRFTATDPNFGFVQDGVASVGFLVEPNAAGTNFQVIEDVPKRSVDSESLLVQFDWDIGNAGTVTGITAYSAFEFDETLSAGLGPIDWFSLDQSEDFEQFSQEIRLVSPGDQSIDYVVGAYYLDREIELGRGAHQAFTNLIPGGPPGFNISTVGEYEEVTTSFSVFGQVTFNLGDNWRLNAGLRHTDEEKKVNQFFLDANFLAPGPLNAVALGILALSPFDISALPTDKISEQSTDPSVSVQWDASESVVLYAAYTKATKAGGFNSARQNPTGLLFDSEEADGYEIGFKGNFGRFELNGAYFYNEFTDLQLAVFDPATAQNIVRNAASATSKGLELDGRYLLTDNLEIGGSVAFLNASYDDFPNALCSSGLSVEADCDLTTNTRNAAGDKLRYAPETSGSVYANYVIDLDNGMQLTLRGDLTYTDDFFADVLNDPFKVQEAYTKMDILVSLAGKENDWKVSLVGKNITDEKTVNFVAGAPAFASANFGPGDPPRRIYLKADYSF